jgi:hypothetical protein
VAVSLDVEEVRPTRETEQGDVVTVISRDFHSYEAEGQAPAYRISEKESVSVE